MLRPDEEGDPPCWEGRIADHRDEPRADRRLALSDRTQVHDLVTVFYREVVFDELLEPLFGEVAEVDWAEHIPKLIDYWCWILFGTDAPLGTVMPAHRRLHELRAIRPEHCDRWHRLWVASIDSRWAGAEADRAKAHAASLMAGLAKRVFGFTWDAQQAGPATAGEPSGP